MDHRAYTLSHDAVAVEASSLPPPILSYDTAANEWRLERAYAYYDRGYALTIPAGFPFDLSSVPRPFWGL
ncbi:MAG: DUF1353 domain-containing protein, partial [Rhodothermales bacterium]|nr:DUF1353 domain-containing protein [Rhodothermales bacterium]